MKKLKRKAYFVNAAIKILKKEGIQGFTARKVADETGYNVGSIYTYFTNLDHLENIASIYFINDYAKELTRKTNKITDPFISYLVMWEIFIIHSLRQPDYFYNVFFSAISQTAELNLFKEYYSLFPEERPTGGLLSGMIEIDRTQDREKYVIDMCVTSKAIHSDMQNYLKDIHLGYFKCVLTDIVKSNLYQPSPRLYCKCMRNFLYSMIVCTSSEYQDLINDMLSFYSDCSEENSEYERYPFK